MSFRIRFLPSGDVVESDRRVRVIEAAEQAGIGIETPCGAIGGCTGCRVRILDNVPAPCAVEHELLGRRAVESGWRLACQTSLEAAATVEIPASVREATCKSFGPEVLDDAGHGLGCAIAIDIGSTTIAAALVDLGTSRVLRSASVLNEQVRHGEDVLARVERAGAGQAGVLEAALFSSLRSALDALGTVDVDEVFACGNSVMSHFLMGEDVTCLGVAPFTPAFTVARERRLDALGGLRVRTFPLIGGHVGGDAVAAALACRLDRVEAPEALIDLGTNCEIVLATPAGVWACSAAAGPAFEGGGIVHGMRAGPGAIDGVRLRPDGELEVHVHSGAQPTGICGTGLVDAVATLLVLDVVDASGRMRRADEVDPRWRDRIVDDRGFDRWFVLRRGEELDLGVHAADVRALQLAKGAIGAGLELLLERAGLAARDIRRVHLCGSFGARLSLASLRRIGLVEGVPAARLRVAGDAAAVGARMAACSPDAWRRAKEMAARTEHVDANEDPAYTERFAQALVFPVARMGGGANGT